MSQAHVESTDRVYREDTLEAYQRGVERSIQVMHDRLGEPLSIDDLADAAYMSRFHFTRVFTQITGASPGRFLAAIRMQEAKRLLLQTDRSVTDISLDVGYNSPGTFSRIFADLVGFAPVRFRQLSRPLLLLTFADVARYLPDNESDSLDSSSAFGEVHCDKRLALIIVAMFLTGVPSSHPLECTCLTESSTFYFRKRIPGRARIFAVGMVPMTTIADAILLNQEQINVASIRLTRESNVPLHLELCPCRAVDPPVVFAFPLLVSELLMANHWSMKS